MDLERMKITNFKRGENIVLVVGLRCYLKKEEGGKKLEMLPDL